MTLIRSTEQFASWRTGIPDQSVAFVPTMGALHTGHLKLIESAAKQCTNVVVSIFVNALQFGDNADFEKYPRSLEIDYEASISAGATVVFAPTANDVFPPDFSNYLVPSDLANHFEGASRPGHFAGVVTVVNRLFELVRPHIAIFGAKDFQQLAVIRDMARKLHPNIQIQSVQTIRDEDRLALSSRNSRLNAQARIAARVIPEALFAIKSEFEAGQSDSAVLKQVALTILENSPSMTVEYLEIVDCENLEIQEMASAQHSIALFAGNIDGVRLIDNIEL